MNRNRPHAFKQTQLRTRVRLTSGSVLLIVVLMILGGMYLAIGANVAGAGRQVMLLETRRAELQRSNAEFTAKLADETTIDKLWERASALGFRPATPDDIEYLVIDGYIPPAPFVAPRPLTSYFNRQGALSPAYTETMVDWAERWLGIGN